jgi:hypothetical protein
LVSLPQPPYTLLSSPSFPADDMARARCLGAACDIFYSRGKAVAWFNAVVRGLKMRPSVLLEKFGDWLAIRNSGEFDEAQFEDSAILRLQQEFLTGLFAEKKQQKLLPATLDCVVYHYHYGAALMAVPPQPPPDQELDSLNLLALPLRRAASVSLATFNYEILDLLESGEPDLPWITKHLPRCGSYAAIYPARGEVCTESLIKPYYQLLEQLDGRRSAGQIAAGLAIRPDDATEFLAFAVAEGLATLPSPCC